MNDPHVESLEYELATTPSFVIEGAPALDHETADFNLHLEGARLTISIKGHCATEAQAQELVAPFLRSWEVDQALQRGRQVMWFKFKRTNIVDRNPTPPGGIVSAQILMAGELNIAMSMTGVLVSRLYPTPPRNFAVSADVEMLWGRYVQYTEGREPLAGMAYACFTFITKVMTNGREDASKRLNIAGHIFKEVGRLAGGKGDRKYPTDGPYTPQETAWLEAAVRLLIRRVGQVAARVPPSQQITMADLPKL